MSTASTHAVFLPDSTSATRLPKCSVVTALPTKAHTTDPTNLSDGETQHIQELIEQQQHRLDEYLQYQAYNWLAGNALDSVDQAATCQGDGEALDTILPQDDLIKLAIWNRMSGGEIFQDFGTDEARRELPQYGAAMNRARESGMAAHVDRLMCGPIQSLESEY